MEKAKRTYNKGDAESDPIVDYKTLSEDGKRLYDEIYNFYDSINIGLLREEAKKMQIKSLTIFTKDILLRKMVTKRIYGRAITNQKKRREVTYFDVCRLNEQALGISKKQEDVTTGEGILKTGEAEAYLRKDFIFDEAECIFIPMFLIEQHNLSDGDYIEGEAIYLDESKTRGLFKVTGINHSPIEQFERETQLEEVEQRRLDFSDIEDSVLRAIERITPFFEGERKMLVGTNALKLGSLAVKISDAFYQRGYKTINLFLDEIEDSESTKVSGEAVIISPSEDIDCDEVAVLTSLYAKNLAKYCGQRIAIIINNVDVLSEKSIKRILSTSQINQNGSLTIILLSSGIEVDCVISKTASYAHSVALLKRDLEVLINTEKSFSDFSFNLGEDEARALIQTRSEAGKEYISINEFNSLYEKNIKGR